MPAMKKLFITADELLDKSYELASIIWTDGYRPTHLIGLWRGGTPIAIAVHEFYDVLGAGCFHMPIKTRRKSLPDGDYDISIIGLPVLLETLDSNSRILLIDDIFDTGLTMSSMIERISQESNLSPEIRTAAIFYKPYENRTNIFPNYYIDKTESWIVFPHEIHEMTEDEIKLKKPFLWSHIQKFSDDWQKAKLDKTV